MIKAIISELGTLHEGTDKDSRIIKSVTPISMNIMVPKTEDGTYSVLARITWLCKDVTNTLFCLTSTYVAEDDVDEEFLVSSPLLADRYYTNYSLTADILMSSLDHFLTDMDFKFKYPDNIHKTNETEIYCQAFDKSETDDPNNDKLHKIMVSPEVYSTLSFVDHYMLDSIINTADLYSALVFGADETNNTFIFDADKVEVLDVAVVKNKHSKNKGLAVKLKARHTGKYESEIELLALVQLEKGKKVLNSNIKKNSINKLGEDYLSSNENHFIQRFMFEDNVSSDNEVNGKYLFIKAVNINKDGILVALNDKVQEEMTDQIDALISNLN